MPPGVDFWAHQLVQIAGPSQVVSENVLLPFGEVQLVTLSFLLSYSAHGASVVWAVASTIVQKGCCE